MGVPQRFYQPFASWLAARGVEVLTLDLRGIGASRHKPLRDEDADLLTWATQDLTAALRLTKQLAPSRPTLWFGHSLGGQLIPFVEGQDSLDQIVTVSAGSGYWRQNSPALRRRVWLLWWGFMPVLTPLFGYFPGQRLGMVGDLPRGAAMQWRRWCLDPSYAVGVLPGARQRFAQVHAPIECIWARDDQMLSIDNVSSLHSFYSGAQVTTRYLEPSDYGLKRIDHFGFFHRSMEEPLWEPLIAPLLDRLPTMLQSA
jgi:predicted alpha/beta hydrolase